MARKSKARELREFPIAEFRIRPSETTRCFLSVKVFRTYLAMQCYLKLHAIATSTKSQECAAAFLVWPKGWSSAREIGEVIFCTRYFELGYVSHELNHAAIEWSIRKHRDPSDDTTEKDGFTGEEFFCDTQQCLLTQFEEKVAGFDLGPTSRDFVGFVPIPTSKKASLPD